MANGQKISALNPGDPAESSDLIPIARSGDNYSVTAQSIADLAAITAAAGTPITVTNGTELSMPAASSSINGYLSSSDWSLFNSKGSGAVSSVTGTSPIVSSGGTSPAISFSPTSLPISATSLDGTETVVVSQGGTTKKTTANIAAKTLFGIYTNATLPAAATTAVGTTAWISDSGGSFVVNNGSAWVSTGGSISGNLTNQGQLIGSDGTAAVYKKTRLNALFFGVTQGNTTDQTSAIQAFLDYCYTNNAAAYFPAGTYLISGTLQYKVAVYGDRPKGADQVYGSGTIFYSARTVRTTMWELPAGTRDWYFEGCQFQGISPYGSSNRVVAIRSSDAVWANVSRNVTPITANFHYAIKDCIFRGCGGAVEVVGYMGYIGNIEMSYCYSGLQLAEANAIIIDGGEAQSGNSGTPGTFDIQIWGNPSKTMGGAINSLGGYIAGILINQFTFESGAAIALDICECVQNVVLKSCYFEQPSGRTAIRAGVVGWNGETTTKGGITFTAVKYLEIGGSLYAAAGTKIELDNVDCVNFDKATGLSGYISKTALTRHITNIPPRPTEYSNWYSTSYAVFGTSNANYSTALMTEPPRSYGYSDTATTNALSAGSTSTVLIDSTKSWPVDGLVNSLVYVALLQEPRRIISNTATTLTVSPAFSEAPPESAQYGISPNMISPVLGGTNNLFANPHFEGGFRGVADLARKGTLVSGAACVQFGPDGTAAHTSKSNVYFLEKETTITRTGKASLKYTRWNNSYYSGLSTFAPCELILANQSAFRNAAGSRVYVAFWWYCPSTNSTVNGTRRLAFGLAYTNTSGTRTFNTVWEVPKLLDGWNRVVRWFDVPKYGPEAPATNPDFAFAFYLDEFTTNVSGSNAVHYFDDLLVCMNPADVQSVISGTYSPYPITSYDSNGDGLIQTSASYVPGGFTIQTASTTNGTNAMTLSAANAIIKVGMPIFCNLAGIPVGTYVTAVAGTSVTMSQNATASLVNAVMYFGTIGAYAVGDTIQNNAPVSGGNIGWVCTSAPVYTLGSMTSGSATLTIPSGVTINNGDTITVFGAGASGANLITTVSSGGGTTSLTLAASASTSVIDYTVMTTGIFKSYGTIA